MKLYLRAFFLTLSLLFLMGFETCFEVNPLNKVQIFFLALILYLEILMMKPGHIWCAGLLWRCA